LAISKSTIVFATFSDSYEQWSHSCPLILRIHIRASSQVPFYGFEALKKISLQNSNVWSFGCRRFWFYSFSNWFSSFQFFNRLTARIFIMAVAVTLGVMMVTFGMIVIVRVVVGLATPHQKYGCNCCE
jgi:hypothetical protein